MTLRSHGRELAPYLTTPWFNTSVQAAFNILPRQSIFLPVRLVSTTAKKMTPKFAYHYGEGTGYYHVSFLGEGCQGTASLVRCVKTGKVRVRKAALYDREISLEGTSFDEGEWCPEVSNFRSYVGINKLIAFQHHPSNFKIHATLINKYCNGKDLRHLFRSYNDFELMVPEALIWRFLNQILDALHYLHRECRPAISHGDIFGGNILVDWPSNPNWRPNFVLADFGISEVHDIAPDLPAYFCQNLMAASSFAQDYRDVSALAFCLMTGDTEDRTCSKHENQRCVEDSYTDELAACADDIYKYSEDLECNINANCGPLRDYIAAKARSRPRNLPSEVARPAPVDSTPLLFDSYEAIMTHTRPPGPYNVVAIDPDTYEILDFISGPHCAEKVFFTDESGRREQMQHNQGFRIPVVDEMQYS